MTLSSPKRAALPGLARHYLRQFFAGDHPAESAARERAAIKVVSALLPIGIVLAQAFQHRYLCFQVRELRGCPWYPDEDSMRVAYRAAFPADEAWLIAATMALTALAASARWDLLFPRVDDLQKLGSLPLSTAQHFVARLAAVCLALAVFLLALVPGSALPFAYFSAGPFSPSQSVARVAAGAAAGMAAGGVAVFFSCVAAQGLVLALSPSAWVREISGVVHGVVFILALCSPAVLWRQDPHAGYWPPGFFLRLSVAIHGGSIRGSLALPAAAAMLPCALSLMLYFAGASRYRKLAEMREASVRRRFGWLAKVVDVCCPDLAGCAVAEFTLKALLRSWRLRRLLLVSSAAATLWLGALLRAASAPEGSPSISGLGSAIVAAIYVAVFGSHRILSTPSDLEANWIFRFHLTDDLPLRNAVEFLVSALALAPILLTGATVLFLTSPGMVTARFLVLILGFSVILLSMRFRRWRKLPFTCVYAGGLGLWQIVVLAIFFPPMVAWTSALLLHASRTWIAWLAVGGIELLILRQIRADGMTAPAELIFEEAVEPSIRQLSITAGA